MLFLKSIHFTLGFSYFSALVGLWGASGALGRPPGDLFWISLVASLVLEALWGPLWMHLGPFWSSCKAFRHPIGSYFLNFKHNFDFTYRCIFKFMFLFIIALFYVAVCEETWSAELPGGSIFMLLGGKLGMGIADTL